MRVGLLTEKGNLINEHQLNREPVPLTLCSYIVNVN